MTRAEFLQVMLAPAAGFAGFQRRPTPLRVRAPELVGGPWINTPGGRPLTLEGRRGQVTVVHFWTFL